ncbi:MAG: Fe-S oxidoreductase, partial [Candidatus Kapaibacterium sp.]
METSNYIFLVVLAVAAGIMARSVSRLVSILAFAKPDNRFDDIGARIRQTVSVALLQKKILRDKNAGPIHAGIFWGFVILLSAAAEAVLEGIHPAWGLTWLGPVYTVFALLSDVFCAFIILGVVMSLWRRYVTKVKRLQVEHEKVEAGLILVTIACIVTSLLFQNAAKVALGHDSTWAVRPLSSLVAGTLFSGVSVPVMDTVYHTAWWIHILLILAFTNYLPYSKHLHVLTSVPNVFFSPVHFPNTLEKIDF